LFNVVRVRRGSSVGRAAAGRAARGGFNSLPRHHSHCLPDSSFVHGLRLLGLLRICPAPEFTRVSLTLPPRLLGVPGGHRKEEFHSSRRCLADGQQGHGKAEPERWDGGTASCPESGSAEPQASTAENRRSAEARGTGRGPAPDAGTSGRHPGAQTQEAHPAAEPETRGSGSRQGPYAREAYRAAEPEASASNSCQGAETREAHRAAEREASGSDSRESAHARIAHSAA